MMMKILTLTSLFPNSSQPLFVNFIKERTKHLANSCVLKVVAPVPYFPPINHISKKWYRFSQVPIKEYIDNLEVYHPRYFLIPKIGMSLYGYFYFLSIYQFMRNLRKKFPFDIIDAHWAYPDGYAAVRIAKALNIPVCVSLRGSDINQYFKMRIIRSYILSSLKRADKIISVSKALKEIIVSRGIPEDKIMVIPNGVDKNRFYYIDKTVARTKLNLPVQAKIVLNVGNLVKVKRQDLLISSIAEVKKSINEIRCYIIGKGNEENSLRKLIEKLGLKKRVFLVGSIPHEELVWWYNAADIFCLCSSKEGCPNVLIESLASGLPVAATAVGGIPEIIHNKECGILIEDRNRKQFHIALQQALTESWDREKISKRMIPRTWDKVAAEIFELMTNVTRLH